MLKKEKNVEKNIDPTSFQKVNQPLNVIVGKGLLYLLP